MIVYQIYMAKPWKYKNQSRMLLRKKGRKIQGLQAQQKLETAWKKWASWPVTVFISGNYLKWAMPLLNQVAHLYNLKTLP